MYWKYIKDALKYQQEHGGTIWYDQELKMFYIIGEARRLIYAIKE